MASSRSSSSAISKQRGNYALEQALLEIQQRRRIRQHRVQPPSTVVKNTQEQDELNNAVHPVHMDPRGFIKLRDARRLSRNAGVGRYASENYNMNKRGRGIHKTGLDVVAAPSLVESSREFHTESHFGGSLSLVPLDEGSHDAFIGRNLQRKHANSELPVGVPFSAVPDRWGQVAPPRARKRKRRAPLIPKQFLQLALIFALGGLTIWQEVEFGYLGNLFSLVQAQGGVAVLVSEFWSALWR